MAKTLRDIQREQFTWQTKNFPQSDWHHAYMGIVEEVGELSHALLKAEQGIRGTKDELHAKEIDAIGDVLIYLLGFCNLRGHDLQQILEDTWTQVKQRDWTNKETHT